MAEEEGSVGVVSDIVNLVPCFVLISGIFKTISAVNTSILIALNRVGTNAT